MSETVTNTALVRSFHDLESEVDAEHISMGYAGKTPSEADVTSAVELNKPSSRFRLPNHIHGMRFSYTLFEEGFLKIQKWKGKTLVEDHYLTLRFMSPVAKVTRVIAKRALYAAAGLLGAGLVAAVLAAVTPYDQIFRSASILLGCGTIISFMLFLHWSHERTHFFTSMGNCEVLTLTGTVESFRACRTIAPAVSKAIRDAQANNTKNEQTYFREEMHEHYRLHRADVITPEDCSDATRKILAKFE